MASTGRLRRAGALSTLAIVLLAGGCAHVGGPQVDRRDEFGVGDVSIVLRYAPEDARAADQVQRVLDAAVTAAERWGPLPPTVTIAIYPTHEALEAASRNSGVRWLRAWARLDSIDLQSPRTWSRGMATDGELRQLLAHELTHLAMYAALGGDPRAVREIPAWFREGMATTNAGERLGGCDCAMMDALTANAAFGDADAPRAYVTANEAFRLLERRHGRQRIRALLALVRAGTPFDDAFHDALGVTVAAFEDEFRSTLAPRPSLG